MKKLVAFDLDGTLAPSKSKVPEQIVNMLKYLIERYEVCIISGGAFHQFEQQLFLSEGWAPKFSSGSIPYHRLHVMPTCGTRYYKMVQGKWELQYSNDFSQPEVQKILHKLGRLITKHRHIFGPREPEWGPQIENRGSQITLSALGQEAPVAVKEVWDPDGSKKRVLQKDLAAELPEFEVRMGGTTSIDVTREGIDKSYGMSKLIRSLGLTVDDVIFFGDKLQPGGNDHPVLEMGIDCVPVKDWKDTLEQVQRRL